MRHVSLRSRSHCILMTIAPLLFVATGYVAVSQQGFALWLPAGLLFVLAPAVDQFLPQNKACLERRPNGLPLVLLRASPIVFLICYIWVLFLGLSDLPAKSLDLFAFWLSMSALGAVALGASGHELLHRHRIRGRIGEFIYLLFGYWHYYIMHMYNHHPHGATVKDNHTPQIGTGYWTYLGNSMRKSMKFSFNFLRNPNRKRGGFFEIASYFGTPLAAVAASGAVGGPAAILMYIFIALFSVIILESCFYLQHYGLSREIGEKFEQWHSWECNYPITNYLIYMAQRHADHHVSMNREYFETTASDDAPSLPCAYPFLVVVTWIPPLWFLLMNKRALKARYEETKARDNLLAA